MITIIGQKMETVDVQSFRKVLILQYLKERGPDYLIHEIKDELGLTYYGVSILLEEMLEEGLLVYNDNVLQMTFKGRIRLQNSGMEIFNNNKNESVTQDSDMYIMKKFSKAKWRK